MPAIARLAPRWGFRKKGVRGPLSIICKEQCRLIFRPIDGVEKHSTPNHFSFESSSVHFPLLGLPDAKLAFRAEFAERIIGRQGTTNAMVHHGQARVCERLIIHPVLHLMKKPPLVCWDQRRFSRSTRDTRRSRQMMRPERLTDGYGSPRASLGRPLVSRDFWSCHGSVNPGQLTAVQLRVSEREHFLRHGLSVSCRIHLISTLLPRAERRHGAAI
jgi:hypothetical protein